MAPVDWQWGSSACAAGGRQGGGQVASRAPGVPLTTNAPYGCPQVAAKPPLVGNTIERTAARGLRRTFVRFEEELTRIAAPTIIISGDGDKRVSGRAEYGSRMRACSLRSLPGANVVAWESPKEACAAVTGFSASLKSN